MKNKYSYILLLLLTTMGLTVSCSKFVMAEYDKDDAAIYLVRTGMGDSLVNSFLESLDNRDTVYLYVRTMGHLSDVDRPFVIKQTNSEDEDAAVPGVHYVPFDDEQMKPYFVMPANRATVSLPIILLRDPSLDTKRVRLALAVVENDNFRPGIDKWREFMVVSTSQAIKPNNWDSSWKGAFGEWSEVKMRFIAEVTGYSDWAFYPEDTFYISHLRSKVKTKLLEYRNTHGDVLRDENGNAVEIPN